MIEKLPFEITQGEYEGKKFDIKNHTSPFDMQVKINELVDAVNELAYTINDHKRQLNNHLCRLLALEDPDEPDDEIPAENVQPDAESRSENVQDPYAEQRKWIGKLCKFWDKDCEDCIYDILHHIDPNCVYKYSRRELGGGYQHCEPVKPDDNIIYKKD